MALQPIVSATEVTTTKSVAEAKDAIAKAVLAIKGARAGAEGWLQFRLGSATWLRLWGLWLPNAYKHLPLIIDASVSDLGTERRIRVDFRSDEGPYLFRLDRVQPAYTRRFAEIAAALHSHLT
jgi:predicted membrane metal-binding protein